MGITGTARRGYGKTIKFLDGYLQGFTGILPEKQGQARRGKLAPQGSCDRQ